MNTYERMIILMAVRYAVSQAGDLAEAYQDSEEDANDGVVRVRVGHKTWSGFAPSADRLAAIAETLEAELIQFNTTESV